MKSQSDEPAQQLVQRIRARRSAGPCVFPSIPTRTTVTLDSDIAARLEGLRKRRDQTFNEALNAALRAGLDLIEFSVKQPTKPYVLHPVSLGPRLPNLDNITEVAATICHDLSDSGKSK